MNKAMLLPLIWLFAMCCQCANQSVAGGSSQQGNGKVAGNAVLSDGTPARYATVIVCPENYFHTSDPDPDSIFVSKTDINGNFNITGIYEGSYIIEVNDLIKSAVIAKVSIDSLSDIGTMQMKPYAWICGTVDYLTSEDQQARYVQIRGLKRLIAVNNDGTFNIDDMPEGIYNLRVFTDSSELSSVEVSGVDIISGDTESLVIPAGWRFGHSLNLNTTSSGADIPINVTGFPVKINLTDENFDFNDAALDGSDLRFTGRGNRYLSYEIGFWDRDNKSAEIWVKIDTVFCNDSTQSVTMFWGNNDSKVQGNFPRVFDTLQGFAGVWYLHENSGKYAIDASENNINGTYYGTLPSFENAFTGGSQRFATPDSDYIDMGNVLNPGSKNISIEIWFKRSSDMTPQALVSKTDGDLPSISYGYLLSIDYNNYPHFYMASGGSEWGNDSAFDISGNFAITDTLTWHHIFVVIDRAVNSNCRMYIDGIDRTGTVNGDITTVTDVINNCNFRIGTESDNNCSFGGLLSNVTISFNVRSSSWIKLAYMNQNAPEKLIRW